MGKISLKDREFDSSLSGKVAIVASEWNSKVVDGLLSGVEEVFDGYKHLLWQVHRVTGAWEIPLMAQKLAEMVEVIEDGSEMRIFDVIVCLGCLVKGETDHYDRVSNECARGCMDVQLQQGVPIVYEVLSVRDVQLAVPRSSGEGNLGRAAARTALDWLVKLGAGSSHSTGSRLALGAN
jgi:6,7-dimethyl-8-ribityllumazine synthase